MNTIESISVVSPNNKSENCAKFVIDTTTVAFRLADITTISTEYTLSLWIKSDSSGSVTILNNSISTTSSWQQKIITFTASETDITFLFTQTGNYYIYHPKLEKGNRATDWSPHPEDIDSRMSDVESTIEQHADEIKQTVRKDNIISSIEQSAETIKISASKINLEGYVTMTSLETEGETVIHGGNILTDSITSKSLSTDAIQSRNYDESAGTGSFLNLSDGSFKSKYLSWTSDGAVTAINGIFSGEITAHTGKIGELSIGANGELYSGTSGSSNSYFVSPVGLGTSTTLANNSRSDWMLGIGSKFGVTSDGILYCSGAVITGYATSNDVAKLVVGDYTNYVTDPTFELDLYNTTGVMAISSDVYHTGSKSLKMGEGAKQYKTFVLNDYKKFPVKSGDRIYVEWYGYRDGADKHARINLQTVDIDNNNIQWDMDGYVNMPANAENQTWIKYSYVGEATYDGFVVITMKESSNDTMSGAWYVDDIIVRRMDTGELIVDGAITANKIATDAIKSQNYSYESGNFSTSGTFFDLANGQIISKNLSVDANGNAYIRGKIDATSGTIGRFTINSSKLSAESQVENYNSSTGEGTGTYAVHTTNLMPDEFTLSYDNPEAKLFTKIHTVSPLKGGSGTTSKIVNMSSSVSIQMSDRPFGCHGIEVFYSVDDSVSKYSSTYTMSEGCFMIDESIYSISSDSSTLDTEYILRYANGKMIFNEKVNLPNTYLSIGTENGIMIYTAEDGVINGSETLFQLKMDGNVKTHSIAPLATETYGCGLDGSRWSTVYTKAINANGNVIMTSVYENTQSYAVNMYIGASGRLYRSTNTSSRTIKHDIKALQGENINAHNLYDVEVVQAKYNEDILNKNDYRYMQDLPMFIIEDLYEKYPMAVDKVSDDVKEWSWNAQYLIPPMLKLIQEQNERINKLEQLLEK